MNDTDNNKNGKTGFEAEFARLERRVEELLIAVDALKEENRARCVSGRNRRGRTLGVCPA